MESVIIILRMSIIATNVHAFDNKSTHRIITESASNTSIFDSYIVNLGLPLGVTSQLPSESGKNVILRPVAVSSG